MAESRDARCMDERDSSAFARLALSSGTWHHIRVYHRTALVPRVRARMQEERLQELLDGNRALQHKITVLQRELDWLRKTTDARQEYDQSKKWDWVHANVFKVVDGKQESTRLEPAPEHFHPNRTPSPSPPLRPKPPPEPSART
eukprot:4686533-Prymnesium_polylepis.1